MTIYGTLSAEYLIRVLCIFESHSILLMYVQEIVWRRYLVSMRVSFQLGSCRTSFFWYPWYLYTTIPIYTWTEGFLLGGRNFGSEHEGVGKFQFKWGFLGLINLGTVYIFVQKKSTFEKNPLWPAPFAPLVFNSVFHSSISKKKTTSTTHTK